MKIIISIFLTLIISFSLTADTEAMDYMLGVKTGYYAWHPYLIDTNAPSFSDIGWGTGMLYGPIVSLVFNPDISFSLAGLTGEQSTHWHSSFSDSSNGQRITGTYNFKTLRIDIDSALSYRISENFKVFAGYKYQYLKLSFKYTEIRTDNSGLITEIQDLQMNDIKIPLHGPAFGLGLSLPLGVKYFLAANISGIYLQGKSKLKAESYNESGGNLIYNSDSKKPLDYKLRQYGLNFEPTAGFSAGEGLPIITLGFRYQRFWVKVPNATGDPFPKKYMSDILIGGFVSAIFMF